MKTEMLPETSMFLLYRPYHRSISVTESISQRLKSDSDQSSVILDSMDTYEDILDETPAFRRYLSYREHGQSSRAFCEKNQDAFARSVLQNETTREESKGNTKPLI